MALVQTQFNPVVTEVRSLEDDENLPQLQGRLHHFDVGSPFLKAGHREWLKKVAAAFVKDAGATVAIQAEASRSGNAEFNRKLSQHRLNQTVNFLVEQGMPLNSLIDVAALGEDNWADLQVADGTESGFMRRVIVSLYARDQRELTRGARRLLLRSAGLRRA